MKSSKSQKVVGEWVKKALRQIYKTTNKHSRFSNIGEIREGGQLGFVTLNGSFAVSGWVGLANDRYLRDETSLKDIIS